MDLGYARVSTTRQDLDRQIDSLLAAGIPTEHVHTDKKTGATTDRPGLRDVLKMARAGDTIVVVTLDRLGRSGRDTLNAVHDLTERGVWLRTLADPIRIDTCTRDDPMSQLARVLMALFAQMERTFMLERAAGARAAALARGKTPGRRRVMTEEMVSYTAFLKDEQHLSITQIAEELGLARTTVHRSLTDRPAQDRPPS